MNRTLLFTSFITFIYAFLEHLYNKCMVTLLDMREIPSFNDFCAVADGRIWSKRSKLFLTPSISSCGYLQVVIRNSVDKKRVCRFVHTLVYSAFNGEVPKGYQINHINEIKTDNSIDNLELLTPKDNCNHGTRNSRIGSYHAKGITLIELSSSGHYTFKSLKEAAEFFSVKATTFRTKVQKRKNNKISIGDSEYYIKKSN